MKRGGRWLDELAQDLRYAARQLVNSPVWSLTVMLTIALGVGANTAIFSVVDAALLHPLAYPDPNRLVLISASVPQKTPLYSFSFPRFEASRERARSFEAVAAYDDEAVTLSDGGEPQKVEGGRVSREFFPLLGATPALGRFFTRAEDAAGGAPVVVLSYSRWTQRYGRDRNVLGRTLRIDDQEYTIVGVAPEAFQFLGEPVEVWRPRMFDTRSYSPAAVRQGAYFLTVIGRLKPGVSLAEARAELAVLDARYKAENPTNADASAAARAQLLRDQVYAGLRSSLLLLWAVLASLLLIACANVANLLLSRAAGKTREIAARRALGATPGRIAQQLLTESVFTALCGGVLALPLGYCATGWLVAALRQSTPRLQAVELNLQTIAFTFGVCAIAAAGFGLAPVVLATSIGEADALHNRQHSESRWSRRFRGTLVAAEFALCAVLLSGAGLLLRSLAALDTAEPGMRIDHVLTATLDLMPDRYRSPAARSAFYDDVLRRVGSAPGVLAAGITTRIDLLQPGLAYPVQAEGAPDLGAKNPIARGRSVSPDYLGTMGIPLIRGRGIAAGDTATSPPVVLVNESFARHFFAGQEPIGRHVEYGNSRVRCEIVGIVRDVRSGVQSTQTSDEIYLPLAQNPLLVSRLVVRVAGDPGMAAGTIRKRIQAADPGQAVDDLVPLAERLASVLRQPRTNAARVAAFAGLALALAAVGIYGVLSYSVAQRTREIGIRMALGADPGDVRGQIVRRSLGYVAIGGAVGFPLAIALARVFDAMLFRVAPSDPVAVAAALVLLALTALLASYAPARRASRVDPAVALRSE